MGREAECVDDTGIWECVDSCAKCSNMEASMPDLMIWHHLEHPESYVIFTNNPFTGQPWTTDEFNALEYGRVPFEAS